MKEVVCPTCGRKAFPYSVASPDRNDLWLCSHEMCEAKFKGPIHLETFAAYHHEVMRTSDNTGAPNHRKAWNGLGLAGESGEVVDLIKKIVFHGKDVPTEQVLLELGDVLWYLAALAQNFGSDLSEVAAMNAEKTLKRYPQGWSKEDANKPRETPPSSLARSLLPARLESISPAMFMEPTADRLGGGAFGVVPRLGAPVEGENTPRFRPCSKCGGHQNDKATGLPCDQCNASGSEKV